AWAYGGKGELYQASDPMVGQEGAGASPWPRLADMLIGQKHIRSGCTAGIDGVIFAARNIGGASVSSLAPGGHGHPAVVSAVEDMLAAGLKPTRVLWHQGEADAEAGEWADVQAKSEKYRKSFLSLVESVRNLGVTAPVYVATATICNARTSAYPFAHEI